MATAVEICNMALGLLGAENITSLTEDTRIAKVCNTFYTTTKLNLLRCHNWNFAMKRASLTSSGTPAFEYKYQITKPNDYLRIVEFYDYAYSFKEEGGYILVNQSTVKAKYIRNDVSEADFDESFVPALASKLASTIAYQITQSATAVQLAQAQHKEDISQARRNNAISNTPDSFQEPVWLTTRL